MDTHIHHAHTHTRAHTHAHMHARTHQRMHTYMHTYMHTHMHTYMRTYMHTHERKVAGRGAATHTGTLRLGWPIWDGHVQHDFTLGRSLLAIALPSPAPAARLALASPATPETLAPSGGAACPPSPPVSPSAVSPHSVPPPPLLSPSRPLRMLPPTAAVPPPSYATTPYVCRSRTGTVVMRTRRWRGMIYRSKKPSCCPPHLQLLCCLDVLAQVGSTWPAVMVITMMDVVLFRRSSEWCRVRTVLACMSEMAATPIRFARPRMLITAVHHDDQASRPQLQRGVATCLPLRW